MYLDVIVRNKVNVDLAFSILARQVLANRYLPSFSHLSLESFCSRFPVLFSLPPSLTFPLLHIDIESGKDVRQQRRQVVSRNSLVPPRPHQWYVGERERGLGGRERREKREERRTGEWGWTIPYVLQESITGHVADKRLWRTSIHQAVIETDFEKLFSILSTDNNIHTSLLPLPFLNYLSSSSNFFIFNCCIWRRWGFINAQDFFMRTALHYACLSQRYATTNKKQKTKNKK